LGVLYYNGYSRSGMGRIALAQIRDRWRALIHANCGSIKCRQYFSGSSRIKNKIKQKINK
jgi:hypothetical protein